ncbi:MAG: flagellar biosynthesis protein FlgA [Rhodospirillales bacterium]|nr:flagellar biosynthesis protein FlgA [Rhodospirillales bacterium]
MNLSHLLQERARQDRPLRVGVIGAGKFGTMFLSQVRRTPGMHLLAVADLDVKRAHASLVETGWSDEQIGATSAAKALANGSTWVTEDSEALINAGGLDVVVEATGVPEAGIKHALAAFERGRHVVMVNVEADVLAGPLLKRKADAADVVYSLAYGDQPSLIAEQVDWARSIGLDVVCAGKGTLYMPEFHASTPDTVWDYYGLTPERAERSGMNAKMFNSFLDGTKSAIEMAAVANACGLDAPAGGLTFPPCATGQLASKLIPSSDGGVLDKKGTVEVVSSRTREGIDIPGDLRWGVYVTFEAPTDYVERCFSDYGLITDESGKYSALWRPYHLIGLELGVSVAWAGLMGLPTGAPRDWKGDVVAVAKRDLEAGETLDGEGGFTVWGRLMTAADSREADAVPIGLAHGITLKHPLPKDAVICWSDVEEPQDSVAYRVRREMEKVFANVAPVRARGAA